MSEKLRECPFCGEGSNILERQGGFWAYCTNDDCGAEVNGQISQEVAIAAWNRRSPDPRLAMAREEMEKIAKDRADWLLDAVACATQDRRFLRGEPEYDEVAGEAILLNAEKAIRVAFDRATLTALEEGK